MANGKTYPSGPKMAENVLAEAGHPLHVSIIVERVLAQDKRRPKSKRAYQGQTPHQTISAALSTSHNAGGTFQRIAPGVFALREWDRATKAKSKAERPESTRAVRKGNGQRKATTKPAASSSRKRGNGAKRAEGKAATKGKRPNGVDPAVAAASTVVREADTPSK